MPFLAGDPDITPITNLITTRIHIGQALVGSIGALAFIFALACMSVTLLSGVSDPDGSTPPMSTVATTTTACSSEPHRLMNPNRRMIDVQAAG
jgi:hypothetical protein